MKKILLLCLQCLLMHAMTAQESTAQDSTGLPGDNFSLEGALELFKNAKTPDQFENALNATDNEVNNLDLNGDDEIDFVRVKDLYDGNAHALVLQAVIGEKEIQDVAVIELEKDGEATAQIQIVGDEDLYGKDAIVEPSNEIANGGQGGPSAMLETSFAYVNVWFWPCVFHLYSPGYTVWLSPWGWQYYPNWYKPYRPHPWRAHYMRSARFRPYYSVVHVHRNVVAHRVYGPRRTTSVVVRERYKNAQPRGNKSTKTSAVQTGPRKSKSDSARPAKSVEPRRSTEENATKNSATKAPKGTRKETNSAKPTRPAKSGVKSTRGGRK